MELLISTYIFYVSFVLGVGAAAYLVDKILTKYEEYEKKKSEKK